MSVRKMLSEEMTRHNEAISHLSTIPSGDERARKVLQLEKARDLLIFADKKLGEGHNVRDVLFRVHELISSVLSP